MYFQAENDWEISNQMISVLLGSETRFYGLIELGYNFNIILLDADIEDEDKVVNTVRFMLGDIKHALSFMNQSIFKSSKISLMSRRCDNHGSYSVSDITKVIEGHDDSDQLGYIYICKNGKEYVDSLLASHSDELKNKRTIYFESNEAGGSF